MKEGRNHQSPSNTDPLALASGKFVRVPGCSAGAKPANIENIRDPTIDASTLLYSEIDEPFSEEIAYAHSRIEGCVWILEDDLHLASIFSQLVVPKTGHVLPSKTNSSTSGF